MAIGAGSPLLNIHGFAKSLQGRPFSSNSLEHAGPLFRGNEHSQDELTDIVEFSEGALKALQEGFAKFRREDIRFAIQRIKAVEERIGIIQNLLNAASPDQRESIISGFESVGRELQNIGSQIKQITGTSAEASMELVQSSYSESFNVAATGDDSESISYSEELNVEFSFLKVSVSEESIQITKTDDGIEIEKTTQQTELVVAQLHVERERTLTIDGEEDTIGNLLAAADELANLLDRFQDAIEGFQALIEDIHTTFLDANENTTPLRELLQEVLDIFGPELPVSLEELLEPQDT